MGKTCYCNTHYITYAGLTKILHILKPKNLTSTSTMFDAGYETAKKEISAVLAKELDIYLESNVSEFIWNEIRKRDG